MNKRYCYNYRGWLHKSIEMLCMIALSLAVAGCNADEEDSIKENPYSGGREPLTVKLLSGNFLNRRLPDHGTKVTFKAAGLAKYSNKDEINSILNFIYLMNNVRLRLLLILH